jgi:hypothetical protein
MTNGSPWVGSAPLSLDRCLAIWGAWERGYSGGPQPVKVATWARAGGVAARADGSAEAHLSSSDKWIAMHVSKAVEALPRREWQIVLEIEYIWNGSLPRVWRSNRLPKEREALDALLASAKEAVAPILRNRIGVRLA